MWTLTIQIDFDRNLRKERRGEAMTKDVFDESIRRAAQEYSRVNEAARQADALLTEKMRDFIVDFQVMAKVEIEPVLNAAIDNLGNSVSAIVSWSSRQDRIDIALLFPERHCGLAFRADPSKLLVTVAKYNARGRDNLRTLMEDSSGDFVVAWKVDDVKASLVQAVVSTFITGSMGRK
jgi:hypothetical protein